MIKITTEIRYNAYRNILKGGEWVKLPLPFYNVKKYHFTFEHNDTERAKVEALDASMETFNNEKIGRSAELEHPKYETRVEFEILSTDIISFSKDTYLTSDPKHLNSSILTFEGIGWVKSMNVRSESDIDNYRILATFIDNDGDVIKLDLSIDMQISAQKTASGKILKQTRTTTNCALLVREAKNLTASKYYNVSDIPFDSVGISDAYMYTKADIIRFIKDYFNITFNDIEIINSRE